MEVMPERRSRPKKGIVVFIDGDSQSCDRIARRLEAGGYHVLTAGNLRHGFELVRVRRPDVVVWRSWRVCHFVRSQSPRARRAMLRCGGPEQLAAVLDELFEGPTARRCQRVKHT